MFRPTTQIAIRRNASSRRSFLSHQPTLSAKIGGFPVRSRRLKSFTERNGNNPSVNTFQVDTQCLSALHLYIPNHQCRLMNSDSSSGVDQTQASLERLVRQLMSYGSLKEALIDRKEDSISALRFSQHILRDLVLVVQKLHEAPPFSPSDLLGMINTLVLPQQDMTIPSHTLDAILDLFITALSRLNNNPSHISLADADVALEALRKLRTIQIYYTVQPTTKERNKWNESAVLALNMTLNLYSHLAFYLTDAAAARSVVQLAESLLVDFGQTNQDLPERLSMIPDVVSFNTVMMAWNKSVKSHQPSGRSSRTRSSRDRAAATTAAERAEAILMLLLDVSRDSPKLRPQTYSYNAVIGAWANSDVKEAPLCAMKLLSSMVKRHRSQPRVHPAPDAATLVVVCKVLNKCSTREVNDYISQLRGYQEEFNIPTEPILGNAILTAFARSIQENRSNAQDYLQTCMHLMDYLDNCVAEPDRITFVLVLDALASCVRKIQRPNEYLREQTKRILDQAKRAGLLDLPMCNDALMAFAYHAEDAAELFREMDSQVDYMSYRRVLEAFEYSIRMSEKCEEFAERAESILSKMEKEAEHDKELRPQTNLYNAVILTWLKLETREAVHRAAAVLLRLDEKYRFRVKAFKKDLSERSIAERPNTTSFISVMNGYSKHGTLEDIPFVEDLFRRMNDLELTKAQVPVNVQRKVAPVTVNTIACNLLLDLYAEHCSSDPSLLVKAENLLETMESSLSGRKPDAHSYSIVMKSYAELRVPNIVDRTMDLLKRARKFVMRNTQKTNWVRLYNSALNAVAADTLEPNSAHAAESLLRDMENEYHLPDNYSFAAVIKAWAALGTVEGLEAAESILRKAIDSNQADSFCFNSVISGYAKLKQRDAASKAKNVFAEMERLFKAGNARVAPTAFTYQSLSIVGTQEDAYQLLLDSIAEYERTGQQKDFPNPRIFSHVISKLFHVNLPEAAMKIEDVVRLKMKYVSGPTQYDIDSTIKKYSSESMMTHAVSLVDEFYVNHEGKQKLSLSAYNSIFAAYAKSSPGSVDFALKASELLKQMETRYHEGAKAKPDGKSYADCISVWVKSQDNSRDERAEELITRMKAMKVEKDDPQVPRACNLALQACIECAKDPKLRKTSVERGARLFTEMMVFQNAISPVSFKYMLKLASFMPERAKLKLCQKLMIQCQRDGLLSPSVLGTFLSLVPRQLSSQVLNVNADRLSSIMVQDLPETWSRNASHDSGSATG